MTVRLAVYRSPDVARWASLHFPQGAPRAVDDLETAPAGALWLCAPEVVEELRLQVERLGLPHLGILAVTSTDEAAPWPALAHDLRGPLGVVSGALEELVGDAQFMDLARRGVDQLTHLASCWQALGRPAQASHCVLSDVLSETVRLIGTLEPRRAERISFGCDDTELSTDRERLTLGLVRIFTHVLRATRQPIRVRGAARGLSITGSEPLGIPRDATIGSPWRHSSRLAMGLALLAPLTARWEMSEDARRLVWVPIGETRT